MSEMSEEMWRLQVIRTLQAQAVVNLRLAKVFLRVLQNAPEEQQQELIGVLNEFLESSQKYVEVLDTIRP